MTAIPQTLYSELVDEMFANVLKNKSEFKLHMWKMKAEKLRSVDVVLYKILLSVIAAYENNYLEGIEIARATLRLTNDKSIQASIYRNIGNMFSHIGEIHESMDAYWTAFKLTNNPSYYELFLSMSIVFSLYDQRLEDMKALDQKKKEKFGELVENLKNDIKNIDACDLNINLFQDIAIKAYGIFYNHCCGRINRYSEISDSNLVTVFFNVNLSVDVVNLLNNQMSEALVDLLGKYEYEEILKYPIVFTSTNYARLTES